MIEWLFVCFWTHVIPTQHIVWPHHHSDIFVCIWLCLCLCRQLSLMTSQRHNVHHDVKNMLQCQKHVMTSIGLLWRQKCVKRFEIKLKKIRYSVKRYVKTTPWPHKKVRHNITNMLWQKSDEVKKVCDVVKKFNGVKMFVRTSISATYVMTSNSLSYQKIVIMP